MMQVFKIGDAVENAYKGAGHAIAAIKDGEIIDLIYIADVIPDFDPEKPGALERAVTDDRLAFPVNRLKLTGCEIFFGMCGGWEFTVL